MQGFYVLMQEQLVMQKAMGETIMDEADDFSDVSEDGMK